MDQEKNADTGRCWCLVWGGVAVAGTFAEKDDGMAAWENTEVRFGVYGQGKYPKEVFRHSLCNTLRMTGVRSVLHSGCRSQALKDLGATSQI